MRDEFNKMVAAAKLAREHVEPLLKLADCGFCMHRSWGFGRIRTMDPVFGRFTIDFPNKPGHAMDLTFAATTLKPIPKDHILARKSADLESMRQMAKKDHLELIKVVLNSFAGSATLDQIQQVLVPDVISDDWKKWWEMARTELKKDGHFQVPLKKNEPIIYQAKEISLQDRLMTEFRAAKGLKARVAVAAEVIKHADDLGDKSGIGTEIITALNSELPSYQRTQPAVALEAIFARDDIHVMAKIAASENEVTAGAVFGGETRLGVVLEALPAVKHRRALEAYKESAPGHWQETLRNSLNAASAKLCRELAGILVQEGHIDQLKETLARLISHHTASSELLLWLAKDRNDSYADILGPEVFRAMLTAMERDQFNEKRSNRLRDFILDDPELLLELIGSADLEVIKDLTRALQYSPSFDDMDKRSLLARIVKSYPAIQSLITGEQTKQEATWIVSWESLERRKEEYRQLVEKTIPANSKEIAIARSYGDLRENHEYKAAKEMQKILMRRKSELEAQLLRARGTDFANPRTEVAGIGTVVRALDLETNVAEQFTILGAWDSDPERGIISYLSPVAQSLLNHKLGDDVEFEIHGVQHHHRIESIEAYKPAPPPENP